ncbi:uncharacterized protein LTR77_004997 [Saxophila tyrrhenica]|uniref:Heterokaryon incompatibility domain-containing protein n=1 Tax=Saxophila tyrrhenica TaxID=1690608 RepID=A0AAV9PB12_9PEZI|nr:hypothetical protein LTR77_004997 [Saxophila tyrrhenica]
MDSYGRHRSPAWDCAVCMHEEGRRSNAGHFALFADVLRDSENRRKYSTLDERAATDRERSNSDLLHHRVRQADQIYAPLSDSQYRVLGILPGSFDGPLRSQLYTRECSDLAPFQHNASFDALSYCWGQPVFTESIECDGVVYPITANLDSALRHIRSEHTTKLLWVDYLCINQTDLKERSQQIRNMGLIFGSARTVVAWLGDAAENTEAAVVCLSRVEKRSIEWDRTCEKHKNVVKSGLGEMLGRPWFRRLWIKQEAVAAGKDHLRFVCGPWQLSRSALAHAAAGYASSKRVRRARHYPVMHNNDSFLPNPFDNMPDFNRHTLASAMHVAAGSECGDPRDRIYGLLGMVQFPAAKSTKASFPDEANLVVDYTRSPLQIMQDAMEYSIKEQGGLRIFSVLWAGTANKGVGVVFGGSIGDAALPSWCPNLALSWVCRPTANAGYRRQWAHLSLQTTIEQPGILNIQGVIIGGVQGDQDHPHRLFLRSWFGIALAKGIQEAMVSPPWGAPISSVETVPLEPKTGDWDVHQWLHDHDPSPRTLDINDRLVLVEGSAALFVLRPVDHAKLVTSFVGLTYLTEPTNVEQAEGLEPSLRLLLHQAEEAGELKHFKVV